jgi:membrane associated rhomboid family serine protease
MIGAGIALFAFLLTIILQLVISSFVYPMPLTDTGTVRYRTIPYVTILLIIINSLVFIIAQAPNLYQGSQLFEEGDPQGYAMLNDYVQQVWTYGFRSSYMHNALSIGSFTTFTAMFMHSDLWHLLGNMIFLWAFGRRVEDACGSLRFLLFYLLAGMIANLGSAVLNPVDLAIDLDRPSVGASGAISGVMGAYLLLFPSAKVDCIWGLGSILRYPIALVAHVIGSPKSLKEAPLWRWTIRLPAWLVLIDFLAQQLIPSFQIIQQQRDLAGVNNLAHLVGFLAALAIILFARKDLVMRFFSGRSV